MDTDKRELKATWVHEQVADLMTIITDISLESNAVLSGITKTLHKLKMPERLRNEPQNTRVILITCLPACPHLPHHLWTETAAFHW